MSEMVERVARAMAAAIVSQPRSGATFDESPELMISDEDSNSFWRLLPVARAAIEAMREPTAEMLRIAVPVPLNSIIEKSYPEGSEAMETATRVDRLTARSSYQALIDAALK